MGRKQVHPNTVKSGDTIYFSKLKIEQVTEVKVFKNRPELETTTIVFEEFEVNVCNRKTVTKVTTD